MEDAATAEICRAQVWQWLRHNSIMADGRTVDDSIVRQTMIETLERLRSQVPEHQLKLAERLYTEMLHSSDFPDFLTLRAYDYLE
jgi:malate synthase